VLGEDRRGPVGLFCVDAVLLEKLDCAVGPRQGAQALDLQKSRFNLTVGVG
jgi:hypothetical protein